MEVLRFTITGEYITNFARTRFWDENCDYEAAEEILLNCLLCDELTLDERKSIARDILEGKSKLTGDSTSGIYVEDDGELVRPISLKINELKNKLLLIEIEKNMETYPEQYIDPYSTVKSVPDADDQIHHIMNRYGIGHTKATIVYFAMSQNAMGEYPNIDDPNSYAYYPAYRTPTKAGLWLLDKPELILKLNGGPLTQNDQEVCSEFWKKIHQYLKDNDDFKSRNFVYEAAIRKYENGGYNGINLEKEAKKNLNTEKENPWFKGRAQAYDIDRRPDPKTSTLDEMNAYLIKNVNDPISSTIFPTPIASATEITGLVAPNGDFYQCSFGDHALKAFNLLYAFRETLNKNHTKISFDIALDFIIKQGYMAVNYRPYRGTYLTTIRDVDRTMTKINVTKEQINTIYDLIVQLDEVPPNGLNELTKELF